MIDFPANPTVGQQFTAAGVTWTFDGTKWTAGGLSVAYLPLAGGTMLGPIVLAADPAAALQPATKQYVDGGRLGDNRIINGDMRIDQRNNGASGTAIGYTIDRWRYGASQASKGTWNRANNSASDIATTGQGYSLKFGSSSAYTVVATDYFALGQYIEADLITDFAWGTSNAQLVTLSFWVYSTVTGLFGGSITNQPNPATRSYPFTFNIPTANAWTKVVVTIPGDTAGTWVLQGNAAGLVLWFDLGSGANNRGPAGAWANGNWNGANGTVNFVATNGANIFLTGVKLEVGSVATAFNHPPLAQALAACQRYYEVGVEPVFYQSTGASAVANAYGSFQFAVQKRAAPTMTFNPSGNWHYFSAGTSTVCYPTSSVVTQFGSDFRVTGATNWNGWDGSGSWQASAEL